MTICLTEIIPGATLRTYILNCTYSKNVFGKYLEFEYLCQIFYICLGTLVHYKVLFKEVSFSISTLTTLSITFFIFNYYFHRIEWCSSSMFPVYAI